MYYKDILQFKIYKKAKNGTQGKNCDQDSKAQSEYPFQKEQALTTFLSLRSV